MIRAGIVLARLIARGGKKLMSILAFGNCLLRPSSTGLPCSNSPREAQCIQTSGRFSPRRSSREPYGLGNPAVSVE